jgi:hypothetical protein
MLPALVTYHGKFLDPCGEGDLHGALSVAHACDCRCVANALAWDVLMRPEDGFHSRGRSTVRLLWEVHEAGDGLCGSCGSVGGESPFKKHTIRVRSKGAETEGYTLLAMVAGSAGVLKRGPGLQGAGRMSVPPVATLVLSGVVGGARALTAS